MMDVVMMDVVMMDVMTEGSQASYLGELVMDLYYLVYELELQEV